MSIDLEPLDEDAATELYRAAFTQPPWDEGAVAVAAFRRRFHEQRAAPDWTAWLATVGGRPAGMVYGSRTPDPLPDARAYPRAAAAAGRHRLSGALEVHELAVAPEARGQGVGSVLLRAVLNEHPRLWLLTLTAATSAMRLYAHNGLHELGRDRDLVVWGHGFARCS